MNEVHVTEQSLSLSRVANVQVLRERRVDDDLRSRRAILSPPVPVGDTEIDDISRVDTQIYNYILCSGYYKSPYAGETEQCLQDLIINSDTAVLAGLLLRLSQIAQNEEELPEILGRVETGALLIRLASRFHDRPLVYALVGVVIQMIAASDSGDSLVRAGILTYLDELARSPYLSDRQCYAMIVGNLLVKGFLPRDILMGPPHLAHRVLTSFIDFSGKRVYNGEYLFNICWALACLCEPPHVGSASLQPLPYNACELLAQFATMILLSKVKVVCQDGADALMKSQRRCMGILSFIAFRNASIASSLAENPEFMARIRSLIATPANYLCLPSLRLVDFLACIQSRSVSLRIIELGIHTELARVAALGQSPRGGWVQHATQAAHALMDLVTIPEAVRHCMTADVVEPMLRLVREDAPVPLNENAAWFFNNLVHYARPEDIGQLVCVHNFLAEFTHSLCLYNASVVGASLTTFSTIFQAGISRFGSFNNSGMQKWLSSFVGGNGIGYLSQMVDGSANCLKQISNQMTIQAVSAAAADLLHFIESNCTMCASSKTEVANSAEGDEAVDFL